MKTLLAALLALLALFHLLTPWGVLAINPDLRSLLLIDLRLPRTLLVIGYGATLGLTGAALQALFANPLASPDVTGSSSGAALGAVVGGYWLGLTEPLALAAHRSPRAARDRGTPRRDLDPPSGRARRLAGVRRRDQPRTGARAIAVRLLRCLRLADG
jgi:predicted acylesterase/phospholipase RssA